MSIISKSVNFNENPKIYITYSSEEYSRFPIYYTKLKWQHRRIPPHLWKSIFIKLDLYKLYEMEVHEESKINTRYHSINNQCHSKH
jgi:hypothetical protein